MRARRHQQHMKQEQKVKAERIKNLHHKLNGYTSASKKRRGRKQSGTSQSRKRIITVVTRH